YGALFRVDASGRETIVHSFSGRDGANPAAGLSRDLANDLYGTASQGGANGYGTVFRVTPSGMITVLHSFTGYADGAGPMGRVIRDFAGNLYGTAMSGTSYGFGTVFKLSSVGKYTALHTFTGTPDGEYPSTGLVGDSAGNLYGTTPTG